MVLERGTLLNNRYRIVEILGQGGMGAVYRAVDENLGVEVALKENLFTTEEYARQFRREAVILASLRHPNLTRVTDHFVIEGQGQYLVMDFIEGEDLRQRMDRVGLLNEEEAILIGAAVCDALTYMDTLNPPIVHRDIKPGNVKITPQGQIFLVDFGLAKIIQSGQSTTSGARAMTPGYSPPEQYGTARTDNRSDLFSLGATLYAALTGAIPEDALARAMGQVTLTPIRKRNPRLSRRLAAAIEKSLEVRPDDRYQSAEEFKQALLSVRGITSKRNAGNYSVTPAPDWADKNGVNGVLLAESQDGVPLSRAEPRSPTPLPSSYVLPLSPTPSKPRPRSRRRGWLALALLTLLLIFAGLVAYNFYPTWPTRALALFIPPAATPIPEVMDSDTPSPTQPEPTSKPTSPGVTTMAPVIAQVTPGVTSSPVPNPTMTSLPVAPPPSAEATATPMGGGSGQIAFASDRTGTVQVWVMNADGSGNPRQITNIPEGACQPAWSPDGMRLVFVSPCMRNQVSYPGSGLFLINADGTNLMPLPTMPGGDYDPAWSPDGKTIAFTSLRTSGGSQIYRINLEDSSVVRLSSLYDRDMQPAWSPDGKQIAFVSNYKGGQQIWMMDPDGSNRRMFSSGGSKLDSNPTWSPDGQVVLFNQLDRAGSVPKLVAVTNKDGVYKEYHYDFGPTPVREPKYSPDGLWLAYEGWPQGSNHEIYLMSASGAGRTKLTNWPRVDFDAIWRPLVQEP